MAFTVLISILALAEPPTCPGIAPEVLMNVTQQVQIIADKNLDRQSARQELRRWSRSQSPPIKLNGSQWKCVREILDASIVLRRKEQVVIRACGTERVDAIRLPFDRMKADGRPRMQVLSDVLEGVAPANPIQTDQEWDRLARTVFCKFALVDLIYGPHQTQRRVEYGKQAFKDLQIPKDMYQRFRTIAKGVCGGPDGLSVVGNLQEIYGNREPRAYSYDEIRMLSIALQVQGQSASKQDWNVVASKLECYLSLIAFAEDLEKVNPRPDTANAWGLRIGTTYVVSDVTPLMPIHNPVGVDEVASAIARAKDISAGGRIRVLAVAEKKDTPWYEVDAWDSRGRSIGRGWVNSMALLGQNLSIAESDGQP